MFGNLAGVALRQPWRLLTFTFLHAGLAHLAFNMLFLMRYGPRAARFHALSWMG